MPWNRYYIGHVRDGGLVHILYEWSKAERVNWDTQCSIMWGSRGNANKGLKPRVSKKPVTCIACIAQQLRCSAVW